MGGLPEGQPSKIQVFLTTTTSRRQQRYQPLGLVQESRATSAVTRWPLSEDQHVQHRLMRPASLAIHHPKAGFLVVSNGHCRWGVCVR